MPHEYLCSNCTEEKWRTVVISIQQSFHRILFFPPSSFSSSDNYCLVINRNYDIDERRKANTAMHKHKYIWIRAADGEAKRSCVSKAKQRERETGEVGKEYVLKIQNQKLYILHWLIAGLVGWLVVLLFSLLGPIFLFGSRLKHFFFLLKIYSCCDYNCG